MLKVAIVGAIILLSVGEANAQTIIVQPQPGQQSTGTCTIEQQNGIWVKVCR